MYVCLEFTKLDLWISILDKYRDYICLHIKIYNNQQQQVQSHTYTNHHLRRTSNSCRLKSFCILTASNNDANQHVYYVVYVCKTFLLCNVTIVYLIKFHLSFYPTGIGSSSLLNNNTYSSDFQNTHNQIGVGMI